MISDDSGVARVFPRVPRITPRIHLIILIVSEKELIYHRPHELKPLSLAQIYVAGYTRIANFRNLDGRIDLKKRSLN